MKVKDRLAALGLALAACLTAVAVPVQSPAADRVIVYPLQNPSSVQTNTMQRYPRLAIGNFLRDMLGASNQGGAYANMQINPVASSMNVTVSPAVNGTDGTLYQLGADDTNPLPINVSPQLASDSTTIMIQGLLSSTTGNIGPMTACGTSGQSVYYLLEAQIQQQDTNPQSQLFVNPAGAKYYQTVNTDRTDAIVFQLKAGSCAVSPTVPSTDSGWISIGTILIPYGTTQITAGMISMSQAFGGFTTATNTVTLYPTPNPTPTQNGHIAISGAAEIGTSVGVGVPAPTVTPGQFQAVTGGFGTSPPTTAGEVAINQGLGVGVAAPGSPATYSILGANAIEAGSAHGPSLTAGDLGASRSTTCGALSIGGSSSSALFDFGCTTSAVTTLNQPLQFTPACTPQVQTYTGTSSDTSGTYTVALCNGVRAFKLWIRVVGGGGGGSGSGSSGGAGSAGDASTFGSSFLTANGGSGGPGISTSGGAGGSASGGNIANFTGQYGGAGPVNSSLAQPGAAGGSTILGLGGGNGFGGGAPGTGCGGGGASGSVNASATANTNGSGGGGGGYVEELLTSPAASYAFVAGKYGSGGATGSNGAAGGNGAPGCIIIVASWAG